MTRSKNEDKPNISKTYPILLEQMSKMLKDLYYNKSQKITNNMVANYTDSGWGLRRVACKNMDLEKFKEKFDNIFIKNLVKTMEKM